MQTDEVRKKRTDAANVACSEPYFKIILIKNPSKGLIHDNATRAEKYRAPVFVTSCSRATAARYLVSFLDEVQGRVAVPVLLARVGPVLQQQLNYLVLAL